MNNYPSRLLIINNKVKQLLEEIALLKNEKNDLNSSNLALSLELNQQKDLIKELNEKVQMLQLAKSIGGEVKPQETTDLKRKINEYIKEIDRCIALLNE